MTVDGALPLVGRRAELAFLTETLVPGSGRRAVVLVGEAGVGKTRLVTEAVRRAGAAGVMVLEGGCLPLSDSVPFLPITEALRGLGPAGGKPGGPPVLDRCGPQVRSELARLIPGWGVAEMPDEHGPVEGWQRARLFAALRDLLEALADDRPSALVIEDVHWADETTLDFLAYFSALDRGGFPPLLMTCREEQIDPSRPVGSRLTELTRRAGVVQLSVGRLSRDEVAEHLRGLVNTRVPSSLVDEIFARAGGNAFFTEQLVAASAGGDGPLRLKIALPRGLAQLLVAQADTVGDDSRRLLEALAIAGRELDEALLASITDLAGARLAAAVRELTSARLIDPAGTDGRYRLRHALVGEAVAAVMLVGERRERHAVVARALSTSAGAERSAEVAEHWAAADDAGEEMPWRQMAAREAERVYAHREAATHWQRLIELWPLAPKDVRPSGLGLVGAYLNAVAALDRCGDTRAAGELAERALRTLAATADPLTRAVVYERVAGHRALDEDGAALAPLETAMELLADLPLGREHAAVLRAYADALWWVNRYDEARRYLDRALQASRSVGATADEVEALCDLPYYAFDAGDIETGMSCLDQAAAICGRDGNQLGAIEVTAVRSEALLALGRLPESIAEAWAGLEAARRVGLEQHAYAQLLRSNVFEALAELGRPADGEDLIRRATESTPTSGASFDHMTRAIVDMLAGDLVAATDRWAAVDAVTHPKNLTYGGNLVDRGALDLWAQRPRDALSRIQGVPQPLDAAQYRRFTAAILTTGVRACADLAEDARARHDVVGEAEARKAAQDLASAHDAMARDPFALHPYWTTGGAEGASWAAELTRLAGMSDPDAWADAAAAWATLGRPHRTAYARWRQAQAFIAAGRTAYAGDCLREAATEAQSHAPLLAEIGKVARVVHVDLDHEQPRADRTVPAPGKLYELTPRELEVLRLVADGLTNTQIGVRLFIGKSTASVHVTNILRKLGAKNRAEAAAIAHRAGLLPPDPP